MMNSNCLLYVTLQIINREVIIRSSKDLVAIKELHVKDETGQTIIKLWDKHSEQNVAIGATVTISYQKIKLY